MSAFKDKSVAKSVQVRTSFLIYFIIQPLGVSMYLQVSEELEAGIGQGKTDLKCYQLVQNSAARCLCVLQAGEELEPGP